MISYAQVGSGELKGKVIDAETGEALPFANVVIKTEGDQIAGATTDFDGKYSLKPIPPGTYIVQATYVGYQPKQINGVQIKSDKTEFLDIKLSQGVALEEFEVIDYEVPLISKDQTQSGGTVTRENIDKMATRSATDVAATVGGVYTSSDGSVNIRGARSSGTDYYIDGIKVRGGSNLPKSAIEQVSVITGGLPAKYGDITGGVISITTRGAAREYFGGLEYVTSGYKIGEDVYGLDSYGHNLVGFNVAGPLFMREDSAGEKESLLGFFLAGELQADVDPRPSAIGSWHVNDSVLADLKETPLRPTGQGQGTFQNAEFLHEDDFSNQKWRRNVSRKSARLQGKIDIATTENSTFTVGGSVDYRDRNSFIRNYQLFNYENNPQVIDNEWRVYGRYSQRFNTSNGDEEKADLIQNAFFSVQVDYSKDFRKVQDDRHKSDLSRYGYIGKFHSTYQNSYTGLQTDTLPDGSSLYGYWHENFQLVSYLFEYDSLNPVRANYTKAYYDSYDEVEDHFENRQQVENGGGLLNGQQPESVYQMWSNVGTAYNSYQISNRSQFRISASGNADIKGHAITLGFEYEQRDDRGYSVAPVGLWTLGRNLVNNHIEQLDRFDQDNYTVEYFGTYPTITFERMNAAPGEYSGDDPQAFFDFNLRKSLDMDPDGKEFIDFGSYGADVWEIDFFSADELLNSGSPYVNYFGYDHKGERTRGNSNLNDFFTKTDEYGNFTRDVAAFRPIYMAGYIQDKFSFDDLIFNIGVRVDRFDANQPVLKDPYSLFPTVKAGEVDADHPSNIGDDFVMYVSDIEEPSADKITGYRDPSSQTFYNGEGVEITDPKTLETGEGRMAPWLTEPSKNTPQTDLTSASFEDYTPQVVMMPRIAFSFPISDEALFYAHYDILTQRPSTGLRMNPIDYLFITEIGESRVNNPNLKPEKTIDYELGFQQKLTNYSSLKISTFYKEQRDMIQVRKIIGAYPVDYLTYGNLDFATTKGMTFSYDLRRRKNVSMKANYTLQFAEGTGSDETSSLNLVTSDNPNLRAIFPLNFDQRHQFTGTFDFRYGSGKNYNGPRWFDRDVFANAGFNLALRGGSGTPYTKSANVYPTGGVSGGSPPRVEGGINGSRLPWNFVVDAKVDKDINLKWGKMDEETGERTRDASLNIYLQVLNVLNSKNTIGVYRATGSPEDDGYLSAAQFQSFINGRNDPESFRDLYRLKLLNPFNYSLPRRIRLGAALNF